MNVKELKGGRELDALIAGKIFGEHVHYFTRSVTVNTEPCRRCNEAKTLFQCTTCETVYHSRMCIPCNVKGGDAYCEVPLGPYHVSRKAYSADIEYAMEVVGKLGVTNFFHLSWMPGLKLWRVSLDSTLFGGPISLTEEAETLPLAICLVALKAVDS